MTGWFESKEAAEELNSLCSFCGLLKFEMYWTDNSFYCLVRCQDANCEEHCKFNHINEQVFIPQNDHADIMDIVRGK